MKTVSAGDLKNAIEKQRSAIHALLVDGGISSEVMNAINEKGIQYVAASSFESSETEAHLIAL